MKTALTIFCAVVHGVPVSPLFETAQCWPLYVTEPQFVAWPGFAVAPVASAADAITETRRGENRRMNLRVDHTRLRSCTRAEQILLVLGAILAMIGAVSMLVALVLDDPYSAARCYGGLERRPMASRRPQTMAKRAREQAVREKREEKAAKKAAAKAARNAPPEELDELGELEPDAPAEDQSA